MAGAGRGRHRRPYLHLPRRSARRRSAHSAAYGACESRARTCTAVGVARRRHAAPATGSGGLPASSRNVARRRRPRRQGVPRLPAGVRVAAGRRSGTGLVRRRLPVRRRAQITRAGAGYAARSNWRECASAFRDPRYAELLFRYRARNWPETLDAEETARWQAFCTARLTRHTALTKLTLDDYFARITELRSEPAAQDKLALLDQLQVWGEQLT